MIIAILYGIALMVPILVFARFRTLFYMVLCRPRKVCTCNAAGTTLSFTLTSWSLLVVELCLRIYRVFVFSMALERAMVATFGVMATVLALALMNIGLTFYELSSSMTIVKNIKRYRWFFAIMSVIVAVIMVALTAVMHPLMARRVQDMVIFVMSLVACVGPFALYFKTIRMMRGEEDAKSTCSILPALILDTLFGSNRVDRKMGISVPRETTGSNNINPNRTTMKFLTRAMRLGSWLSMMLFLGFCFELWAGLLAVVLETGALRLHTLALALSYISLGFAQYQLFWFLSFGYTTKPKSNPQSQQDPTIVQVSSATS